MKKISIIFLLSPLLLITGCSTTPEQCDPTNTNIGIMDKISCNYSGNYQARIDKKEQILENEKRANAQFREIYATIERQKNSTSLSVKQKQTQLQKLKKELTQLTSEVKQKAKNRDDLQAQVNDIEQQLKKVNNSNSSELEKQVELDKLNKKLQQLQKALNLGK
jgi:Membrane-bound metallopeptidase